MGDTKRGIEFAKFIKRNYPKNKFKTVIIPADGNLVTANELASHFDSIVVIDPKPRKRPKSPNIKLRGGLFFSDSDIEADLILGMHPDEATGEIIEYSKINRVPFAIVPCCALGKFSPRKTTYSGWLNILKQRISGFTSFKETILDIKGRNIIIYTHRISLKP